jgi:hypothetical protein
MVDATVAERAKLAPERTADLQALCQGSFGVFGIPIALAKGKAQHDKRNTEKDRDWDREKGRLMRHKVSSKA